MRLHTSILLFFISCYSYGQGSIKSHYTNAYNCKQGGGCNTYGEGYRQDLLIQFDENELKWAKSIFEGFAICELRKKTDTYIIGLLDELYVYADLVNKSIYYIDFVNDHYQTWGYGP
ncbi:MAG: hypothetical protein AAGG59_10150, partial [Bacteroidota bacterium]